MRLYRARTVSSRPQRQPAYEGNEPFLRIVGRWFTSDRDQAVAHGATTFRTGTWEIVAVDVPDGIVDGYRVATTPNTSCGLSPIDFADRPDVEYVLPTFRVMDAVVERAAAERVRDVIDITPLIQRRPAALAA